jgi:hypothetical protein
VYAVLAGAVAAAAAWLSCGSLVVAAGDATRAALLPLDPGHIAIALLAGAAAFAAAWQPARSRGVLIALSPLAFVLLPWLPLEVPAAFLLWTGPILTLLWIACAIAVVAVVQRDTTYYNATPPRRQCLHAAILSFIVFAAAAWCASPSLPGGDEPHYLVITQSLLYDHDLKIENNHQRGDYHAYFAGDLKPDFVQRGRNGAVYSIHAPGLPALVVPAFAIGGYRGVVLFLILVAAAAGALAWWLAWRATTSAAAAWFGWATVALACPFLVETYTVYPDGPGAAVVLTGVWALMRTEWETVDHSTRWQPWLFHGLALALLPWMHTRFAVLAATLGGLILVRLARTPNPVAKAIAFLSVPAVSALGWLFFFVIVYGMPDPSAPYGRQAQNSFAYLSNGLGGLLFDQGFGLFFTAPALAVALAGFSHARRLAVDYAVMVGPYLLIVATFAMWWAGWSGPARFLVPVLLPLAVPAARAWSASAVHRGIRTVMLAALVVTLWISAVTAGVGGGRLAYHARNDAGTTPAPWTEWASRAVDLSSALPAYVPLPVGTAIGARQTAARAGTLAALPWLVACALIAAVARWRSRSEPERLLTIVTWSSALATMACATIVWHLSAAEPVREAFSELSALRTLSSAPTMVVDLRRYRVVPSARYAASITIDVDPGASRSRGVPRSNRPVAVLPSIPAGDYRLSVTGPPAEGWVMAGIAQDQFAIATAPLSTFEDGVMLRFPVDVRSIVVRSDETARDAIRRLTLRPVHLLSPGERLTDDVARRAVRYSSTVVFFLDDRSFAEPSGFWVGGSRSTSVVIAPDAREASIDIAVRNAPVQNEVTLEAGQWRQVVTLAPGEERDVRVPIDPSRNAALLRLTSSSGFRPSETEPGNRDARFLGVYVRVR